MYGATLIQQGLLPFLQAVYFDKNNDDQLLRLEVIFCWMNISGGRNSQLLFDTGIFPTLVENVTAGGGRVVLRGGEAFYGCYLQLHL